MPETAITAAIITSIAAAGTTASAAAAAEAKSHGSGVSGTIINETSYSFNVMSYKPKHGHWLDHPSNIISSVDDILDTLRSTVKLVQDGRDPTDAELLYYLTQYLNKSKDGAFVRSAVTSWEMKGANKGSEGLIRLKQVGFPTNEIYVLIRKRPLGDYGAGVCITRSSWVESMGWGIVDSPEGWDFCQHIMDADNSGPSSFFSDGASVTANNHPFSITFGGALAAEFTIRHI